SVSIFRNWVSRSLRVRSARANPSAFTSSTTAPKLLPSGRLRSRPSSLPACAAWSEVSFVIAVSGRRTSARRVWRALSSEVGLAFPPCPGRAGSRIVFLSALVSISFVLNWSRDRVAPHHRLSVREPPDRPPDRREYGLESDSQARGIDNSAGR